MVYGYDIYTLLYLVVFGIYFGVIFFLPLQEKFTFSVKNILTYMGMHNNIFFARVVNGGERKRESKALGQRRPRVSLLGCDVR